MSRSELASKIGVHYSMIEGIEAGRHFPGLVTAQKLAKELGIDINEMLGEILAGKNSEAMGAA